VKHVAIPEANGEETKEEPINVCTMLSGRKDGVTLSTFHSCMCWGPSSSEGPQKHDLTMFPKCNI
jgi:hypothetical protein